MSDRIELLDKLKDRLDEIHELSNALTEQEVCLEFTISSEQKTVNIKTQKSFDIIVKATINQEL